LAKTERLGIEYRIVPIIDTHTHSSGPDNDGPVSGIVNVMDECGVEQSFVFAPLLSASGKTLTDKALDDVRVHNDYVAHLCSQSAERLLAFCVLNLNPRIAGGDADRTAELMVEEARRCYHELGIRGCKLVPDHWTAEDEHAIRLFEELARLGMYVVFHAGIFMDERSSSWCRPAFYEGVHQVEAFHGQLAHLGWPWVDECIAALLMQTEHRRPAVARRPLIRLPARLAAGLSQKGDQQPAAGMAAVRVGSVLAGRCVPVRRAVLHAPAEHARGGRD
jgi:hypothetical protein